MTRLAALITGAIIALAVTLSAAGLASATPPPEPGYSYTLRYEITGPFYLGYYRDAFLDVQRPGGAYAGHVAFSATYATNHLGQRRRFLEIDNDPGANVHVRVDSGSSVVDYHATTAGGLFKHVFYYGVRKWRVTLDDWASPWFAPPLP